MRTLNGEVKGQHDGLMYYTIGQRQGLGIGGSGEPWFVVGKNLEDNVLYVGQGYNQDALYADGLEAIDINWLIDGDFSEPFSCKAKFRYRQVECPVMIYPQKDGSLMVQFDEQQRAITPGQAVVFYDDDVCIGGGTIERVYKNEQPVKHLA